MDDYSYVRYEKSGRVYDFGQANLADVAGTDATQHLTNLKTINDQLAKAKAGQNGGDATPFTVQVDVVRQQVQNITRTARAIGQDDPAYNTLFRPPKAFNPRAVTTAADAILGNLIVDPDKDDDAAKAAKAARIARFVAKGLPADFATQLQTDRDRIDDARTAEHDAFNEGVLSTAAIGRLVSDAMKECNNLDAIFHNVYAHNPDKLRAWLSASHLERVPHRPKDQPTPTPPAGTGSK